MVNDLHRTAELDGAGRVLAANQQLLSGVVRTRNGDDRHAGAAEMVRATRRKSRRARGGGRRGGSVVWRNGRKEGGTGGDR